MAEWWLWVVGCGLWVVLMWTMMEGACVSGDLLGSGRGVKEGLDVAAVIDGLMERVHLQRGRWSVIAAMRLVKYF